MEIENIQYTEFDASKIPVMGKKLETIFDNNPDINKTAYLNWRTRCADDSKGQFVIMGDAFFSTAYNLIQQCLIDNSDKKADSWIFPILFNIVHGIEVYLKAINAILSVALGKTRGITEGGHDLKGLCATARNLIIEYKNLNKNITTQQMFEAIKVVERFIDNIYNKTDDMTFARYPMDKDKHGHFYINALDNEVIDIELLNAQIVYVYHMLRFIYNLQELDLENKAATAAAMMEHFE